MRKRIRNILIILSVIILILGIIVGNSVSNELISYITTNDNLTVDDTDISGLAELTGLFGAKMIGTFIIFGSIGIDIVIWILYGIGILIMKLIRKSKERKNKI